MHKGIYQIIGAIQIAWLVEQLPRIGKGDQLDKTPKFMKDLLHHNRKVIKVVVEIAGSGNI